MMRIAGEAVPRAPSRAIDSIQSTAWDFRRAIWLAPLVAAWILAAIMTQVSAFNAHPDEIYHARAAGYYREHWLPPKFGDADAVPSYSLYGMSYLHDREIVYLLAGKFMKVVGPLVRDTDKGYRLFNLTLFGLLIVWFVYATKGRPLLISLLLSAQVWYVFSYFNGDAFALVVGFFCAYQAAAPESAFSVALAGASRGRTIRGIVLFGVAIGLLLLAKRDFYVLLPFLAAYIALRELNARAAALIALFTLVAIVAMFDAPGFVPMSVYLVVEVLLVFVLAFDVVRAGRNRDVRRRIVLCACSLIIGIALFAPRVLYDKLVVENPANALSTATATAERFAAPGYKPSDIRAGHGYPTLHLRAHGVSYTDVLFARGFLWKSFKSAVGLYGWLTLASPLPYYAIVAAAFAALLFVVFRDARAERDGVALKVMLIASAFGVLIVLLSSLHSWIDDFEAQGRYFFPMLPVLGVVLLELRKTSRAAAATTFALFLLASYSFGFTGLELIEKG